MISVCIPCVKQHIVYLDDCLKSIERQSLQPYEVIIALSGVNKHVINTVQNNMRHYRLNIKVIGTCEKQYAGDNRNRAVRESDGDIITFIDADDMMRSDRLYAIDQIFTNHPDCIGLLHYFEENTFEDPHKDTKEAICSMPYKFSAKLHFGHSTFRRSVFSEYQYTSKPRGQDVEFVHNVLQKYLDQLRVCPMTLTYYHSNRSTFF